MLKDGKLVPVSRNGDLRRLYPAQRRAIRQEAERLNLGRKEIDRYAHTTMELVDKGGEPAIRSKLVLWQPSEYSYRARKTGVRVLKPHYDEDLPAAYFSVQEREPDPVVDENAVLATFRNKVYTIGDARTQKGTRATISGYIRDLATGEPLEDAPAPMCSPIRKASTASPFPRGKTSSISRNSPARTWTCRWS